MYNLLSHPFSSAQLRQGIGVTLIFCFGAFIYYQQSSRMAALFAVGLCLGLVLYHSSFGFTSSFRALLTDRRSAGFRAQMWMLGLACCLFFPALAKGELFGQELSGFEAPLSVALLIGAFLFGIGMQLGGGCGSGTLFTVGGGNTRMVLTLLFFIVGSVFGVVHRDWWDARPSIDPPTLIVAWGWPLALAINCLLFIAAYLIARGMELQRHGTLTSISDFKPASLWRGQWPVMAGAIALALLNFATLLLAGRPWGITSAFGLWGGQFLQALHLPVHQWSGYVDMQEALADSLLSDVTSVMDFGIMLGAMLAALLAQKFKPSWHISARHAAASIVGGLLLGYGARLAYGCNIGAFFSGIASGSLHGWVWIVCAMMGNWVGIRWRPMFDLPV